MVLNARDMVENDFLPNRLASACWRGPKQRMPRTTASQSLARQPSGRRRTEWDTICKAVAEGRDPWKVTMGEIMTRDPLSIDSGEAIASASQIMTEKGVRRLLVKKKGQVGEGFITSKTMLARMNDYVDKASAQISRLQTPWLLVSPS